MLSITKPFALPFYDPLPVYFTVYSMNIISNPSNPHTLTWYWSRRYAAWGGVGQENPATFSLSVDASSLARDERVCVLCVVCVVCVLCMVCVVRCKKLTQKTDRDAKE